MNKYDLSSEVIKILESYEFEDIMTTLVLCQIYFISERVLKENQFEYVKLLSNLLVSSYLEYSEENIHGTSQAKH